MGDQQGAQRHAGEAADDEWPDQPDVDESPKAGSVEVCPMMEQIKTSGTAMAGATT